MAVNTMKTKSPSRRIRQLENCLRDVNRWISDRSNDLRACGRIDGDNPDLRHLRQLQTRVHRTINPRTNHEKET